MGTCCPGCTTVNLPESNFCNQCGQFLSKINSSFSDQDLPNPLFSEVLKNPTPKTASGERKYVTVLLSDLSGYTTLTQRLDPEEVKEIVGRLFREITKVVTKYEGCIEKYIGGAAMAVFGATCADEDDPIRAILAAKEIHELVDTACEEQVGQTLSMHTGINTGLAITGDVNFDKGTHGIAGATLNLAAHLCRLAKPGDILVESETYRRAIGYFNFDTLEPARLKGLAAPIQVYKIISRIALPKKIHRFHGLRADLIGRNPEFELLKEALGRVRSGKGCLVSLCGNAGTGKSRLVEDFKSTLTPEEANWREGHCYPFARNITYFPLIDLISRTLGIEERDPSELVREKIESGLEFVEHKDDVIPYVGSLYNLGFKQLEGISPEAWRLRFQKAILEILTVMARRAPTIICLEDLHWADPSSLDLIRYLLSDFRYPALVICVYRPTLAFLPNQQIANLGESCMEIRLEDLSPAETQTMVQSLLKTERIPLALKRFVQEKTGGNPFYLEELINSLVESKTLTYENAHWVLNKSIGNSALSASIHGMITARIDRLESGMKSILQEASVIGRAFYYEILGQITEIDNTLWHHLSSLEALDLIKARNYKPAVEYIFKHALTQHVVYNGLLKTKRSAIHERVGLVMEEMFADRLADHYEALAYHFQRGQSPEKAVGYLVKSGEKSMGRYALEEAHKYYRDAFDILSKQDKRLGNTDNLLTDLLNKWSFVYYYRGRYKELLSLLKDHQALAEILPDKDKRGMFHAWLGCALWHREQFKQAHQHLLTALALGEEQNNFKTVGYACCWLAWVSAELGLLGDAIGYAEKAQKIYQAGSGDDYIYVSSMAGMGYARWHQGNKSETLDAGNALLDFGQKQCDYRAEGMGYCCIGWSNLIGGELSQADRFFERAVKVSVDPWYALFPKLALAFGMILNGKVLDAQNYITEILEFSQEFGAEFVGGPALFFQGMVLVTQGETGKGLQILEGCYQSWIKNGNKLRYTTCGSILATVYASLARKARFRQQEKFALLAEKRATAYFKKSIESARQMGATATLEKVYRDWSDFCEDRGNNEKVNEYFVETAVDIQMCESVLLKTQFEVDFPIA
jgi:class 3 adenylate cyclase/tetratricopeptide (TPR) repeat protein